jgi:glycosyltransferase involved in cell wall biosynthesis
MKNTGLRVSMICEQLLQPVPGGIGSYVRAMLRALPRCGIEVEPVVAWHRDATLYDAGLSHARRLRTDRRRLYDHWTKGRRPGVGGTADIVHAPSLAFPARDTRPLVVTVHDTLFLDHPDLYTERGVEFHKAMLDRLGDADMVIVPSRAAERDLRGAAPHTPRIRVIPMGTDMRPPEDAERDDILDKLGVERPYVLWVGTVEPRKNPEGVVRGYVAALDAGVPRSTELNLYLVGPPGWWSGDVGGFLDSRGVASRVRRLDYQPKRALQALYAGAEAFLFPSFAEGFGLPVIEAMACGAPVVTSNRSSLPEVAGSAALLCDPDDPDSIGDALAKILRDPGLAQDLRRLGQRRAFAFTWARTARSTMAAYREVLDESARNLPAELSGAP